MATATQRVRTDSISEAGMGDSLSEYVVHRDMDNDPVIRKHSYSELHHSDSMDVLSEFSDKSYKNVLRLPFDAGCSISQYVDAKPGQELLARQDSISEVGSLHSDTSLTVPRGNYFQPIRGERPPDALLSDHDLIDAWNDDGNLERQSFGASSPVTFDELAGQDDAKNKMAGVVREQVKRLQWGTVDTVNPPTLPENSPHNVRPSVSQHLVDPYTRYNLHTGRFNYGTVSPAPLLWQDDGLDELLANPVQPLSARPATPPRPRGWDSSGGQFDHESARPPGSYQRTPQAVNHPEAYPHVDSPRPRPLGAVTRWSQPERWLDSDSDYSPSDPIQPLPDDFPVHKFPIYMQLRQLQRERRAKGTGLYRGIENLGPKDHETCGCHFLTLPRRAEALCWTNGNDCPTEDLRVGAPARAAPGGPNTCPEDDCGDGAYPDAFCQDCHGRLDICAAAVNTMIRSNQREEYMRKAGNDDEGSSVDGPLSHTKKLLTAPTSGPEGNVRYTPGKPRDSLTLTSNLELHKFLGPQDSQVPVMTSCVRYYSATTGGVHDRD